MAVSRVANNNVHYSTLNHHIVMLKSGCEVLA